MVAPRPLDALLRERDALFPLRAAVPILWHLLDAEITFSAITTAGADTIATPAAVSASSCSQQALAATPLTLVVSSAPSHSTAQQPAVTNGSSPNMSHPSLLLSGLSDRSLAPTNAPSATSSDTAYATLSPPDLAVAVVKSAPSSSSSSSSLTVVPSNIGTHTQLHQLPSSAPPFFSASVSSSCFTPSCASWLFHPGGAGHTVNTAPVFATDHSPAPNTIAMFQNVSISASISGSQAPIATVAHAGNPGVLLTGRKRAKLPVPADKYPEYNFVGRLLGPRGTTLKTLERETGCKIMIRGKGSIRKDKEAEVRGKPGWEHVFQEPLHVVIEVGDTVDEADASRALIRAREAVELLLVPVPEERDGLKRQQLRDLAILNGTFRGSSAQQMSTPPAPGCMPSEFYGVQNIRGHSIQGQDIFSPPVELQGAQSPLTSQYKTYMHPHALQLQSLHGQFLYASEMQPESSLGVTTSSGFGGCSSSCPPPISTYTNPANPCINDLTISSQFSQCPQIGERSNHANFPISLNPPQYSADPRASGAAAVEHIDASLASPPINANPAPVESNAVVQQVDPEVQLSKQYQSFLFGNTSTYLEPSEFSLTSPVSTLKSSSPPRPKWGIPAFGLFSLNSLGSDSLLEYGTTRAPSFAPPSARSAAATTNRPSAFVEIPRSSSIVGENDSNHSRSSTASVEDDDTAGGTSDFRPSTSFSSSRYSSAFLGTDYYNGAFTNFPTAPGNPGH